MAVAAETEIALRPPHRSRRALLTHRAPTLDGDEEPSSVDTQFANCRTQGLGKPESFDFRSRTREHQSIQRLVLIALRSEPVAEAQELRLIGSASRLQRPLGR